MYLDPKHMEPSPDENRGKNRGGGFQHRHERLGSGWTLAAGAAPAAELEVP